MNRLQPTSITLQEIEGQRAFYHRPYEVHAIPELTPERFRELCSRYQGTLPTEIATTLLTVPQLPSSVVEIDGGWNAPRYSWTLELHTAPSMFREVIYILRGFTGERVPGVEPTWDNLFLYLNSVDVIHRNQFLGPDRKIVWINKQADSFQVLANRTTAQQFTQRPFDMFVLSEHQGLLVDPNGVGLDGVFDTRYRLGPRCVRHNPQRNNVEHRYLEEMIAVWREASVLQAGHMTDGELYRECYTTLGHHETLYRYDIVLDLLDGLGMIHGKGVSGAQLLEAFPHCGMEELELTVKESDSSVGDSRLWSDTTPEVVLCDKLARAAIEAAHRLRYDTFTAVVGCNDSTLLTAEGKYADDLPVVDFPTCPPELEELQKLFINTPYRTATIDCNLGGECTVKLHGTNLESVQHTYPAFADALTTPVISLNELQPLAMSADLLQYFTVN